MLQAQYTRSVILIFNFIAHLQANKELLNQVLTNAIKDIKTFGF